MKTKTCIIAMLLASGLINSHAQDTWTQKADFGRTATYGTVGFSIGGKGYVGTGSDFSSGYTMDFWEYDPSTNAWTQKANFQGTPRDRAVGFSIGSKGYIGTGSNGNVFKDFWEYDPATNSWIQKADFGGTARFDATGFSSGSKGYLGTGYNGSYLKDFWEYDPVTNTWAQKADFGGTIRSFAVGFFIGSKGYMGTGLTDSTHTFHKDFWEYTPDNLAIVMLSTTNLIFGAQLEGTRSAAQFVTLTNSGPVTLTISSITASGDFLQKNDCGSSVPAGESCTIKVAFKPSAKGVRTGTVTITDDAANSPQTIALTGTGTVVQVSPLALDFSDQIVGTTSDPQTATITNISNEVLRIFGVGIIGPNFGDFAATTTCGSKLAAGGSCTIDVTFTPGARGDRHASLKIVDDGGGSPQAVSLRGTGISQ